MIDLSLAPKQQAEYNQPTEPLSDPLEAFRCSMLEYGLEPGVIIPDGSLQRFDIDKRGDKAGWYVFYHGEVCGGAFGNWKTGLNEKWCSKSSHEMTDAESAEYKRHVAEAKRQRLEQEKRNHEAAKIRATVVWDAAEPASPDHIYLKRKGVKPHGIRQRSDGVLLVPAYDADGVLWGYSRIWPDGEKRYLCQGKKQGCCYTISGSEQIFICEGFSTGASIHEATGATVIISFDCTNLGPVSRMVRDRCPAQNITIAGDDDQFTVSNPGRSKAERAACEIGAKAVFPIFKDLSTEPTDFNDLATLEGVEAVKMQLQSVPCGYLADALLSLAVTKEYTEMLGEEEWLFLNLIIKNQIIVIIAKSGGGKTTIFFEYVAPYMILNHGVEVFYLDCDSPTSDHKRMYERVMQIGPKFHWINPLTHGQGPDTLIDILNNFVKQKQRLDDRVFILDTLKKFIDMLDKRSVKPFFALMRQLTALGATVVLLGHANKHRGPDGNLVFEGVGDVLSDTDALIVFERMAAIGGIDVTTVIDPDKGAKVRGLYDSISFHIDSQRQVTQYETAIPIPDWTESPKKAKLTDEEIEEKIREFLIGRTIDTTQSDIVSALKKEKGISYHKLRQVLNGCAVHEIDAAMPGQIVFQSGLYNKKTYSVFQSDSRGGKQKNHTN